ncbi:Putative Ig domain-containing protein [Eubacterium callanderi]|uniref:YDG domain-containing protein n=1 Tax=Eubacterium callanderi TaxID=53442 RepID=UPI0008E59DA5|nr:YDG domain-containing protein [Eubacterium callanderi]SFP15227.1 Putative Ig domain-containing protein [Eubacterium callanderi]
MNKNDLIRGGTLFKPLLVLVLSMVLLLSGAVLPAREAQAAPAAPKPTREVDLSQGNVTVKDKEVVRVYQNSGTTTVNNITVPNGVNATVILENVNRVLNGSGYAFFNIMENANVKILLKGKNKSTTSGTIAGLNVAIRKGSSLTIEDYGNGDGELDIAHLTNGGNSYPILGAIDGGTGSLTINSGKVIATSRYWGTAIGAGDNSTLNLTVNDPAVVEAHSLGQGAAIGTISGQTVNATVNATINGGTVRADNCSEWMIGSNMRAGAVIGTGVAEKGTQNVTLNIPKASTAKLYLDTFYGGAAIGGSGSANVAANGLLSGSSKQSVTANIEGGTLDIVVRGQGAGIGSGAGVTYNQTIEANIGGGNITIHNDLDIADTKAGDATGPAIGVGLLTQNATVTCNVTGGNLQMLSQDKGDKAAASPAVGVGAMNKKNPTTSKWTQSKGNTVNFNVKGGTISAETRSSDKTIMDVGAIENNDLNVKVDGGSFNVVNGQMSVKAQNSKTKDVYPATVCLGNMSGTSTVDSATIDGQSYGSDLKTQSGKLYLWTTPGIKKIIASVAGDSRDYTNPKADLAYGSGFTFTEPNVSLKKTVVPADLGRFSIKSVGEDNVTVQVSGVVSGVPVAVQAFDHLTGKPVGNPQSVTSGKTDYTFTGLSKNKTYDIKTFVSDQENYWEAESDAFMVKPFAYAPELADAQLRGPYEGSVAVGNGDYTYALAPGAALPEGLKLTRDGQITGTPTATGSTIFNVIATAADQDIAQGNSRTATVTLNVVPITSEATLVDALGQPLEGCSCKIETQTLNDEIGVGDVVAYTVTPCPEHVFVKFNLNGQDIGAGGVQVVNGIAKYSYTVKPGDKNLNMRAFMDNREIIGLEKVSEAPDLDLFANDEKNTSAEKLQSHIDNSVVLRATYNDNTTKEGKASELGLSWTTNDGYNLKGNTYHYVVSSGDASVKQVLTVNSVKAELNPLNDVMRTVSAEGYPTIEALGLPKTADCQYPDGVTVSEADRHPAINWTTEVPADFGKTVTEAPVVFEGTAAVPAWATIESNAVSVNVSISDVKITGLERVGEAPDLNLFANDEKNASAEELQNYIDNSVVLKATYNDGTTRDGKASELGLGWATNDGYNLKGNTYHYIVRGGDASVEQVLTVNSVNAELDPLSDVVRTARTEGYSTIEELGLPETADCQYPDGVTVSEADRHPAINWTTEVPADFGKTATEAPVVFEGTAAVPAWATITSNAVSVNVSIRDGALTITGLEKVGEAPDLNLFANDENNASAEELQSYIDHNIILKATYNNGTTKNGKASDLGLNWATNDAYNLKGNTYHYVVRGGDAMVEQVLTVNSVNAELDPLNDIMRTVSADGYPTIEALGLPKTVGCKYPAGVTVSEADRQPAINWTTEVPVDFGKTATETPVVFEGTAAVPAWATITSNAVSVNVSISDKVILIPEIKIADKVYDGTKDAVVAETPALDPASLIAGSEVQLEGTAVAVFNAADAGNNIPVKVTGLTLTGADAGRYILDLNQATGNIIPATITLSDITLEDKTVTEDGNPQTLEIKGTLPEGVSVSYTYEREGSGEAVNLPPSVPGTYTVTATFKTDANHVVEPETMSAKLVIKEKTAGVVVEEITTGLTEEQAAGMNAAILKNGEAVQVGDTVMAGDKLTYQFAPAAVREAYVPYAFTMNGETVVLTKLAEGKGYSAEYTIKEGDTALKADAKCVLLGNFSGDDKINIIDAQQIAQTAAAGGEIGDIQKAAGDVNFDGKINVIDAQRVAQYAADTSVVF